MPFQPAEDAVQAAMTWSGPDQIRWQNNLHFTKSNFNDDDMDTLLAILSVVFTTDDIRAAVSDDAILGGITLTDLRTQGARQIASTIGVAGTNVNDMAAQGAALVVTLRTEVRGRSYRGRIYFCGLGDDQIEEGEWVIATATNLTGFFSELQDAAAIAGWTFVVLSRHLNSVERPVALGQQITQILVRSLLPGSQRRRNRRP